MLDILLLKTLIIANSPSDWETYSPDDSGIFSSPESVLCMCAMPCSKSHSVVCYHSQPSNLPTRWNMNRISFESWNLRHHSSKGSPPPILLSDQELKCTKFVKCTYWLACKRGCIVSLNNTPSRKIDIEGCIFPDFIKAHSGFQTTWFKIHFSFHVMVYLNPD